jgi:hypothetical protein
MVPGDSGTTRSRPPLVPIGLLDWLGLPGRDDMVAVRELVRREFTVDVGLRDAWEHLASVDCSTSWAKHIRRVKLAQRARQDGVVDVLEERADELAGIAPAIESCRWSPIVPEDVIERMEGLARRDRLRSEGHRGRSRRRS